MRSTNRNSFIRSLKSKGFKEEIVIKIGLYDLVTSTTLESNKSLTKLENARILYENSDKTAAEVCKVAGVGRRIFFAYLAEKRKTSPHGAHPTGS